MALTDEQKKQIAELEAWLILEISKIKKRELEILHQYDQRRVKLVQAKIAQQLDLP